MLGVILVWSIAIVNSGNHALSFCSILEKKGYYFEVVATPCKIAKEGCSYSIKFPSQYKDVLLSEAHKNGVMIREIYEIVPELMKNIYKKIY